jgi:hypothetical protein
MQEGTFGEAIDSLLHATSVRWKGVRADSASTTVLLTSILD